MFECVFELFPIRFPNWTGLVGPGWTEEPLVRLSGSGEEVVTEDKSLTVITSESVGRCT